MNLKYDIHMRIQSDSSKISSSKYNIEFSNVNMMFSTLVQNENCRLDERKKMSQSAFRDRMNTDPLPARPQKNAPSSSPAEKPVYVPEETKNKEQHETRDLSTSTHAYSGYDNVIFYRCKLIFF